MQGRATETRVLLITSICLVADVSERDELTDSLTTSSREMVVE